MTISCQDSGVELEGKYITIEVVNIGNLPTTLTHWNFAIYKNFPDRFLGKPIHQGTVISEIDEVPQLLGAGEVWYGAIKQSEIDKYRSETESILVYMSVVHASSDKIKLLRLKNIR